MARNRGLVFAMEEIQEEESAAAVAEAPLAVDSLETEMLDVNEQAMEIDDTNTAIEEAVEDTDTLEDIANVMDDSVEEGGMDPVAAKVAEVAVESIYARLGVKKSHSLPAMESFGSKGTRIAATKIAVEGIKEGIKYVWEQIKAAAAKVWGWIKSFLATIFNTAGKLKERAIALGAKIKGLIGKKPSAAKVRSLSYTELSEGIKATEELANASASNTESMAQPMTDSNFVNAVKDESSLEKLKAIDVKLSGFKSDGKVDEDGNITYKSEPMVDGSVIEVKIPSKTTMGEAFLKALSKQTVRKSKKGAKSVATEDDSITDVKFTEVNTATPEEMIGVCEKISIIAKVTEAAKSIAAKISSTANSFLQMIKNIGTAIVNAAKDVAGMFQRAFSAISRTVSSFIAMVYNSIVSSGKAALDWVEKHYRAYTAKKEPAAA